MEDEKVISLEGCEYESMIGNSEIIKLIFNGKELPIEISATINLHGVGNDKRKKENAYAEIKETKDHITINARSGDFESKKIILGYPSLRIGNCPWGLVSNFSFGRLNEYEKIKIKTDYDFSLKGNANLIFDIWLTKERDGIPKKGDVEIMIWLDYKHKPSWKKLPDFKDFQVSHQQKKRKDGWEVFAFFDNKKSRKISFDLVEIINHIKSEVDLENHFIRSIEIGNEFLKNVELTTKIYDLEIELTE
jgi:hypothetical protein